MLFFRTYRKNTKLINIYTMQTLKELTSTSFDSIHEIVVNHLIENYGECDHDKHGEMLSEIISNLNKKHY